MKKIVVFGTSGHSRVVIDAVEQQQHYQCIGFVDPTAPIGSKIGAYSVLGRESDLTQLIASYGIEEGVIAIGDNAVRGNVASAIRDQVAGFSFATVVHPQSVIAKDVVIGEGSVVLAGAIINPGTRIGRHALLNTACSLDHDSLLGDFASLAPRSVTGGNVHIGAYSAVGIGAVVKHGISIGEHTVIGAGATVLTNIGSFKVAYGTPAREIRDRKLGERYL